MSGNNAKEVLMRQWEMLRKIPAHGEGITVADLHTSLEADGYSVDIRTIQRNVVDMSAIFPIINDESAKPKWRWMKDANLDIPNLSVPDAVSIKMMQDYLTPLLPKAVLNALKDRFMRAEERLGQIKSPLGRWSDKIRTVIPGHPLQSPVIPEGIMETVQTALIEEHQVKALYKGRFSNDTTEYILHPLAIVQRGPISYLVATAFSYEDVRLYALHRFVSVEDLGDEVAIPDGFDIDTYISRGALSFGSGEPIKLKLRIKSDLKTTLTESPLSDDMVIETEGESFIVTATVQHTWQLKWWIRSQGPQAEVLEPTDLREEFKESLRETAALYGM